MKRGRPRAFKRVLQEARAALGLSKAEAARRLGIPYRTYQNWELGLRTPQASFTRSAVIEKLDRIALAEKWWKKTHGDVIALEQKCDKFLETTNERKQK